jgi:hypothetical protein
MIMHHTEDMTIEQAITEMPETPGRGGLFVLLRVFSLGGF